MEWLAKNAPTIIASVVAIGGAFAWTWPKAWNGFKSWLTVNYVHRDDFDAYKKNVKEEHEKELAALKENITHRFEEVDGDIERTAEAGLQLSNRIDNQVQGITQSLLNGNNNHHEN